MHVRNKKSYVDFLPIGRWLIRLGGPQRNKHINILINVKDCKAKINH